MSLPLADIKRGKVQSFRDVADALEGMASANRDMKRGVERLPIMGDGWKGVSGDAAHHDLDAHGKYLDGHAQAQQSAAAKIRAAADEFEGVQQLLKKIENDAAQGKFTINYDTGEVTPPSGKYDKNELDYLTNTLRQISAAGGIANADLEAAVKAAQTLPDPSGAVAQGLPSMSGSTIKPGGVAAGLEHLAAPDPNADPGATRAAAAAGADTQANYKEWYPKTPGSGDKLTIDPSKAGSLTGTVGALDKMPGAPKPQDGFGSGVAKQFLKGANERVDGTIDEVKSKAGLNGADKFAESWTNSAKGLEHQIERTLFPGAAMAEDAKNVIDQAVTSYQHPEKIPENIGKTTVDGAIIGGTAPLGGEGALGRLGVEESAAARGALPDSPGMLHDAPPTPGHISVETPSSPMHPDPVVGHQDSVADHLTPNAAPDAPSHPSGPLPPQGEPGSFGYDADGNRLPYANSGRPDYGPTQLEDVWNLSREEQMGQIGDKVLNLPEPGAGQQWVELHPNGPRGDDWVVQDGHRLIEWQPGEPRKGLWDMGHVGGSEYRDLKQDYLRGDLTYDEFLEIFRDPNNYRVQDPYRNRSHIDEGP
ncbi:Alpha/beta hydrolase of uncharacterised function (DUF1023) [Mycobacteroides abscessus subsp. bolletii]|uniref:HNH/ENDO VII family nuclease n=1 Tax=Mycobacteroides abscessus TaxID=36809 RepID=UPI0009A6E3A9|nr:HNH/ENDO VII family nuclease [Mycobacteroides abscessus]SKX65763.1 Alpha/beta hydrolase of uncharacterised function (DUF1023) [Mycobacteroides abscessus subsp. bolletii]